MMFLIVRTAIKRRSDSELVVSEYIYQGYLCILCAILYKVQSAGYILPEAGRTFVALCFSFSSFVWYFREPQHEEIDKEKLEYLQSPWINQGNIHDALTFWIHEWEKHMEGARLMPDFKSYAETVHDLMKRFENLPRDIELKGITPENRWTKVGELSEALKNIIGGYPMLQVLPSKSGPPYRLFQIVIWLDEKLRVLDCPYDHEMCGEEREDTLWDHEIVAFPDHA